MARILLIEDDEELVTSTARLLRRKGHEVDVALDGREGVARARDGLPEVIVSDVTMPELDGYAVLELLRADPRTALIPVIFASAHGEERDIRTGMGLGADDFLVKPFRLQDLLRSIEVRLERSRTIRARLDGLYRNLTSALPHEFRTPLHGILGMASLIFDGADGELRPGELRDFARVILQSGERLRHLVENYVLFTRLYLSSELGRCDHEGGERAVSVLPSALEEDMTGLARRHGRIGDLSCRFEAAFVALASQELSRLVWELADNAFKFSRPLTPVRIEAVVDDGAWRLVVEDRGLGMTPAQIEGVGPFVQFERERHAQAGLGLGLTLARLLCEEAGGRFALRSEAGRGTRVEARIPLA